MTPFDGAALLVMLLTFYPVVSVANLRLARAERPEYFAAGVLFGTHGEKLRLPDGRVFDLIFDVDGPGRRWQVIDVTAGDDGGPSPWPLEPGPLTPIDPELVLPPPIDRAFEALVSGHLADVDNSTRALDQSREDLASAGDGTEADGVYEESAGAAAAALEDHVRMYDELDPSDVITQTDGLGGRIGDAQTDYPDPEAVAPPDDLPVPDPGPVPVPEGQDNV